MSHRRIPVAFVCLATLASLMAQAPALAADETLAWRLPFSPAGQCAPSRSVGCSNHGRFRVEVAWQNQFNNTGGAGVVVNQASTDETLAFSFGDPANIELLVKILNFGDVVKLFYGELTDLHFQITVTDMAHGTSKLYGNTPGDCGAIDGTAFPAQGARAGGAEAGWPRAGKPLISGVSGISGAFETTMPVDAARPAIGIVEGSRAVGASGAAQDIAAARAGNAVTGSCRPDATTLCLLNGRFSAKVTWQNQFNAIIGSGMAVPLSNLTGTFSFTDPANKELLVKILDFGDHIAVYYGSLSNLQYSLQVTDTSTGGTKTYFNPPNNYCGGLDNAFPSHLQASTSFNLIPVDRANAQHQTNDVAIVPFTTATGGTVTITADWTSAADDVAIVLFAGDCTLEDAVQNGCDRNTIEEARTRNKPEQLVRPGLAPGTYTIMIIDFGPNDETGTMTAVVTP